MVWILSSIKCYSADLMDSNIEVFSTKEKAEEAFKQMRKEFISEQLEGLELDDIYDSNASITEYGNYFSYVSEYGDLEYQLNVSVKEVL